MPEKRNFGTPDMTLKERGKCIWGAFTDEEKEHATCCGLELDNACAAEDHEQFIGSNGTVYKRRKNPPPIEEYDNVSRVQDIIRGEEVRFLRLLDQIGEKGPRELEKRGISPHTFGYLAATLGWPVEATMSQLVSEDYSREHHQEARDIQLQLSSGK